MQDAPKVVWGILYVSVTFFPSLKQNFIAYRSISYSNNLLHFQECTTILNAHTKKVWKRIGCPSYMSFYTALLIGIWPLFSSFNQRFYSKVYIYMTHVAGTNSTNINVVFFFVTDLKKVHYNTY